MSFKDYQNIHQMIKETVDKYSSRTAYRWFLEDGQSMSIIWEEFYNQVKKVAKSLMSLNVQKNDKVTILSYSCFRWVLTDMGVVSIGACTVGIYQSNLPKDCKYIINHSDAVVIFVEDEKQLQKILEIRQEIPNIRKVILFQGNYKGDEQIITFEEFLNLGKDISDEEFQKRVDAVSPQDPAGIVYTSGTTGISKGAVLTNDNVTFTVQSVRDSVLWLEGDECFLYLPLAHVFARTCVYTCVLIGAAMSFARSVNTIPDDIKSSKPHWFPSVPRIYEKAYTKIISKAETKGGMMLKIFRWACSVGNKMSEYKLKKQPMPLFLDLQYKLANALVFKKVQQAFGSRVRWCISGAAPLNPQIAKFFHACGILILEGIGMTENMSFTNVNRFDNYRFGWVGPPGPGIEQKIADDGEILYRGRNLMKEYYKMPQETAKIIDKDGWLYTGDLGEIDSENFLRITGRKKDLIITSGGKNIAPSAIEGVLATSKYLSQVCVIGDQKNFLTALVTVNADNVQEYARDHHILFDEMDALIKDERIIQLINSEIAEKNKQFPSYETIKKVTIIPEFTIENGLLTPTLKLKKNLAFEKYKKEIEAMYLS